jgi:hypothetical protein
MGAWERLALRKTLLLLFLGSTALILLVSSNLLTASSPDPEMRWLERVETDRGIAYRIEAPEELRSQIIGGPFERSFRVWRPQEIDRKLTIAPRDGVAEVTSPGFDLARDEVLLFYDQDALRRYGNRPYYAVVLYGGESLRLEEIQAEQTREIGNTGIYMARIPTYVQVEHLRVHKVYAQAPPPEKTYEVTWQNKVEVKYTPDCDC